MRKKLRALLIAVVMIALCPLQASASEVCNHDWSEWGTFREPTCGEMGAEGKYCKKCWKVDHILIPATGKHTWGSWSVSKAATVNKTGTKKRVCTECNTSQTKKIAKLKPFVKLTKKTVSLQVSKTYTLKPKYAKGDSIKKYKSSNTKVATVTKKGKITAKRKGTAKITVTTKSGKKVTCTVKVTPKKKSTKKTTTVGGTVYWVPNGSVYHSTSDCPTLSRSRTIYKGSKSKCPKAKACKVCH